ncbi:hypothetical protein M427DRAFT_130794 [Gonapodya prolifera JEL478]|uniref:Uncharacterized protein n=1 Tax=Gonapodya prolifera (strain JEL478) TaxID=1344416 RepID=A0A139AXH1_GONPJ|nr:hypothetical protein M427DRAFT_130794 [Gonapodya prolifera JEL478]|eukprot:KXS21273.1 hypothetical protein M427DRAFT_130794 [Gonapodya prolifera JEL478]
MAFLDPRFDESQAAAYLAQRHGAPPPPPPEGATQSTPPPPENGLPTEPGPAPLGSTSLPSMLGALPAALLGHDNDDDDEMDIEI